MTTTPLSPIAVALVDSNADARVRLGERLEADGRFLIVASEPLDATIPRRLALLRPTLVVLDPVSDGQFDLLAVQAVRLAVPRGRVVVRTALVDYTLVPVLQGLGVCGYLVPGATPGPWLCLTLALIAETGAAVLAPSVVAALSQAASGQALLSADVAPPLLSPRARLVLHHLGQGLSCAAIAAAMGVSERTVRRDLAKLRRTLDAPSLRALSVRARELEPRG